MAQNQQREVPVRIVSTLLPDGNGSNTMDITNFGSVEMLHMAEEYIWPA